MDFILRFQHTLDKPDVRKIVEIGFGDWSMAQELYLSDRQYIGYEIVNKFAGSPNPNVKLNYIKTV